MGSSSSRQLAAHIIETCDNVVSETEDISKVLLQDDIVSSLRSSWVCNFLTGSSFFWDWQKFGHNCLSRIVRSSTRLSIDGRRSNFTQQICGAGPCIHSGFSNKRGLTNLDFSNPIGQLYSFLKDSRLDQPDRILLYRLCLLTSYRLVKRYDRTTEIADIVVVFRSPADPKSLIIHNWRHWAKLGSNYERLVEKFGGQGALTLFSHEDPQWSKRSARLVRSY